MGLWLSVFRAFVNLGYTLTILLLLSSVRFVCVVMLGDGSSSVTLSYLKVFNIQIILKFFVVVCKSLPRFDTKSEPFH